MCRSPTAATDQAIQALPAAAWLEAASRNAFSRPAEAFRRSKRALASLAGWAVSRAQAARKATARRSVRSRRLMASVLLRPVGIDRDRTVDRREPDNRRARVAELDRAGIVGPVLPRSLARPGAALKRRPPGALDADGRGVALGDRQGKRTVPRLRFELPVPVVAREVDGDRPVLRRDRHVAGVSGDADGPVDRVGLDGAGALLEGDRPVLRFGLAPPGGIPDRHAPFRRARRDRAGHAGHGERPVADLEIQSG